MPEAATDTLLREWTAFRAQQDQRDAEAQRLGTATQETVNQLTTRLADIQASAAEWEARHRELENRLTRPGLGMPGGAQDAALRRTAAAWMSRRSGRRVDPGHVDLDQIQHYNDAFRAYVVDGRERLTPDHLHILNTMSSGSNPDGGYFVSPQMDETILSMQVETSPVRRVATTRTITTKSIGGRRRIGRATASWVFETQARPATTTPQVGLWKIDAHELYAMPEDTQENLEDASMDIESWLTGELTDEFGYAENTAFILGTGVGQPRGIVTYPAGTPSESNWDVIEQVNSGAAALLTADGLVNLVGALKTPYLQNAAFLMRRSTMTAATELKETTTGAYLLRPDFSAGVAWRLLGFPVIECADIAAVAAGALAIAFGDFARGYLIVDRRDMTVLRDPFTNKPFVRFYCTKRVGADITNPEAIKIQKIST